MKKSSTIIQLCLLFAGLLANQPIFAQVPIVSVATSEFNETLHRSRQIRNSGPLVGFQTYNGRFNLDDPTVTVAGIKETDKLICLTISHVSGTYLGKAKIINRSFASTVSFRLPATLLKDVSSDPKEYAVFAQASSQDFCHSRNDILFAGWGTRAPSSRAVIALSASPTATARISFEGAEGQSVCRAASSYLGFSNLTFQSFSRVCEVSFSLTCKARSRFEIIINESGRRVSVPPMTLRRAC